MQTHLSDTTNKYQAPFNMCTGLNASSPRFQNRVCAKYSKCLFGKFLKTKSAPKWHYSNTFQILISSKCLLPSKENLYF